MKLTHHAAAGALNRSIADSRNETTTNYSTPVGTNFVMRGMEIRLAIIASRGVRAFGTGGCSHQNFIRPAHDGVLHLLQIIFHPVEPIHTLLEMI